MNMMGQMMQMHRKMTGGKAGGGITGPQAYLGTLDSGDDGTITPEEPSAGLAGVEGLEPPTLGFGDRCSTN